MHYLSQSVTVTRKHILIFTAALATVLLILFGGFGMYCCTRFNQLKTAHDLHIQTQTAMAETVNVYILKEYSGKIGIFEAGKETPIRILDVYTFTLPDADRTALRAGIRVYSGDALRSLIEDFTA